MLFPKSAQWFINPLHREFKHNALSLREVFKGLVAKRRKELAQGKTDLMEGCLLSILLNDDLFKNDDTMIIDECLTFFFAGTQTSSVAL
jgi:cytochrome P450